MKNFINKLKTALAFVCVMLMMSSCYSRTREARESKAMPEALKMYDKTAEEKYTVNTYTDSSRTSIEVIKRGDRVIYYDSAVYSQRHAKLPSFRYVEDHR